jgi:hypothetical protein
MDFDRIFKQNLTFLLDKGKKHKGNAINQEIEKSA